MKKKMAITHLVITLSLYYTAAYCGPTLITSEYYSDGGTRCVKYEKDGSVIKCCIDHREYGTNKVFIGDYPGKENARIITRQEMKSVHDDIEEIMKGTEYKKYSAMSPAEMRALIIFNNHELDEKKAKEHEKANSYKSLDNFNQELSRRLKK